MIIGVAGKKRSGKDTFYSLLKEDLSAYYNVKKYAFADSVKEYACAYFNIDIREIKKEENRYLLQGIGQMFREEIDENYWINQVMSKINKSRKSNRNELSVITDVRYRNEADAIINQENGMLIKIVNPNNTLIDFHISENDLNEYEFDYVIENKGSIENYRNEISSWIKSQLPWITHL